MMTFRKPFQRANMAERRGESWRPPILAPHTGRISQWRDCARQFLDLQYGSIRRDLAQLLPQFRGTVVDVGCGAQPYRSLLSPEVKYVGIDSAAADDNFGYCHPDVTYFSGEHWPLEDASADALLCTETLEHVAEPAIFLAEANRCLRQGGQLLLTVPFAARAHFVPNDYWRFTAIGLRTILERARFTNVAVFARGNAATVAAYKAMALILPLLFPQSAGIVKKVILGLMGLLLSPLLIFFAIIGNLSLLGDGGDDCLGYTVTARKPVLSDGPTL